MSSANDLITLKDIIKEYPQGEGFVRALNGVNLSVKRGEFIAIMGPSGGGKSTLMHTIGFLDRPTSGTYVFDGRDTTSLDENARAAIRNLQVGFVFQSFNLLPRTTVLENVMLPAAYTPGADMAKVKERALMLLEKVHLMHRMHANPNQLSGGEMQRTAIARALINDPPLILADEPTGNLDTKTSDEVMDLISSLNEEGSTIIMVTHEDDVGRRAKRIVRIRDGRIEA